MPVSLGMELLSDRVSLLLLRDVFRGTRRYQRLKNDLGLSHAVLAHRLRHLEDAGLLAPKQYSDHPPRFEYELAPKGEAYWKVIVSLWRWEMLHCRDRADTVARLRHRACGQIMHPWFGCETCRDEVRLDSPVAVGADTSTLLHLLANTPHRYRRAGARSHPSFASLGTDGVFTVLRDRWVPLILLSLVKGLVRFTEIQRNLGISPPLLARQLAEMAANGLIEAVSVPGQRYGAYRLLDRGADLRPALILSHLWANQWADGGPQPDLELQHGDHPLAATWFCDACQTPLGKGHIDVEGVRPYSF